MINIFKKSNKNITTMKRTNNTKRIKHRKKKILSQKKNMMKKLLKIKINVKRV